VQRNTNGFKIKIWFFKEILQRHKYQKSELFVFSRLPFVLALKLSFLKSERNALIRSWQRTLPTLRANIIEVFTIQNLDFGVKAVHKIYFVWICTKKSATRLQSFWYGGLSFKSDFGFHNLESHGTYHTIKCKDDKIGGYGGWWWLGFEVMVDTGRKIMLSVLVNLGAWRAREGLGFFPAQKMPIYFFSL